MQLSLELYVPRKDSPAVFADKWSPTLNHPLVKTVSVTRGTGPDYCAEANRTFLRELKRVAPHLELISHVTLSHLEPGLIESLLDIGVTSILALTGDDERSEFAKKQGLKHSTDLLRYLQHYFPQVRCYASGYPNGFAGEGSDGLRQACDVAFAKADACPNVTLVTQWSYGLISQLRFINAISQPGLIGYFPFKNMAHAQRVADRCGLVDTLGELDAKVSLQRLEEVASYSWQSRFASDLSKAIEASRSSCQSLAGFHLFTMNDLDVTDQALALASPLLIPESAKRAAAAS